MNFKTLLFLCLFLAHLPISAQNELDALRFSNSGIGGTARSLAMGNAFGALGADLSALHINPAGLGLYRKNELLVGFGNEFNQTSAVHYGTTTDGNIYKFNLSNLGIALTYPSEKKGTGWVSTHIGISYARTANFDRVLKINGFNPNSSILDNFVMEANGVLPEDLESNFPFTSSLAWETFTIDPLDTVSNTYIGLFPNGNVQQNYELESSGRMSETAFTFAANYKHRLYIGAGMAFVSARYNERYVHRETRGNGSDELLELEYEQDLNTRGSGANFKIGIIYRISKKFRVGGSFQSPSFLVMNDTWATSMKSKFDDGSSFEQNSINGEFTWNLNTPMRSTISAATVIGARGLISIDYEVMDMSGAKMKRSNSSLSDYDFAFENEQINTVFRSSNELRVGTEWKIRRLVLRGGYAMRQYPLKREFTTKNDATVSYSGGIGYRVRAFSMDLTYRRSEYFEDRYLYDPDLIAPSGVTTTLNELILAFAYRY